MRIGLYGLPSAGKTFILDAVRNFDVLSGSFLLKKLAPDFHFLSKEEKKCVRKKLAAKLKEKDNFIMDGHYSFGDEVVFTEEDGVLYDAILYLYVNPSVLEERMKHSEKNKGYHTFDIGKWQMFEIDSLRQYCQKHNKDFYVLDNPKTGSFLDIHTILEFIDSLAAGFSCVSYARACVHSILDTVHSKEICLSDGDKTLILEDSSDIFGYRTHIFDGNFYTGFQTWRHTREMTDFFCHIPLTDLSFEKLGVHFHPVVMEKITMPCVILTSGHYEVWKKIAKERNMLMYGGRQMSAETKYFITKFLQEKGRKVIAYGDSMNDYYMLKQADEGYLVAKSDGTLSHSLKNKNVEGLKIV